MANKYFKAFNFFKGKVSPTIKSVGPNVGKSKIKKALSDFKVSTAKAKGSIKKDVAKVGSMIDEQSRALRQTQQKQKGEKVTESGVSKGKDRVNRRFGSPKPKTNVQKIKETFAPKKNLSPKQMKIAKLAGNKNKIDAADFKKLRGRG
jgi:hypothetical protein